MRVDRHGRPFIDKFLNDKKDKEENLFYRENRHDLGPEVNSAMRANATIKTLDDSNFEATAQTVFFINQGTVSVRINEITLGPLDYLEVTSERKSITHDRYRIKFLSDLPSASLITTITTTLGLVYSGRRLLILKQKKIPTSYV